MSLQLSQMNVLSENDKNIMSRLSSPSCRYDIQKGPVLSRVDKILILNAVRLVFYQSRNGYTYSTLLVE